MSPPLKIASSIFLFLSLFFFLLSNAQVETFTYVNEGEFGPYITENDATYRVLPIFSSPFQMAFYNITPGEYYLALRMGTVRSESTFRWVWQANPFRPVGENAIFSLLPDGNLILAESDGTIVWQTGTANRGVVGLRILPNGNIVLYDSQDSFVWQSFDHPTDTLLVGQSLNITGPNRLVSKNGAYSFVLESVGFGLYINNVTSQPLKYGQVSDFTNVTGVRFIAEPETEEAYPYELGFALDPPDRGSIYLARPKYNATLSFLRIENDGNLVIYTFYAPVDFQAWERTLVWFSDDLGQADGCDLPSKCGALGVCEDDMCVACPTSSGLLGWSRNCTTPTLGDCQNANRYYEVVGVENFLSTYGEGVENVSVEACENMCSLDCECLGFLYWEGEAKCWLAPLLGTLKSLDNSTHVAYIKYENVGRLKYA